MRRSVILLWALLASSLLPSAALAAERPYETKDLTFSVEAQGTTCKVKAWLVLPKGVSKSNPAPAILATNGFGGSRDEFYSKEHETDPTKPMKLAQSYASRGYVFLSYSGLGFGGSTCKITLDDPDTDGVAGKQLVDFLAGKTDLGTGMKLDSVATEAPGDPLVGMIGGSYGGQIQFAIASQDPRLDALVPQITWNDLSYSLTPNNTDFARGVTYNTPGVVKLDWPVLFTALGFADPLKNQSPDATHLGPCPNFADDVCPGLVTSGALGYPTPQTLALLRHASVASYIDKIRIPTFLSQGQSDTLFNLQEAVATYKALRAQGTPVKMLWRSAGHSGGGLGSQESNAAAPEQAYESRQALEWFDFWLKGVGDAPKLDFQFLRDWALPKSGDAAPAVGTTPSYPAGSDETLFLSSDKTLAPTPAAAKPGSVNFAAVTGSPAGNGNGSGYVPVPLPEAQGTNATFTGAPLASDFDLVGIPRLNLTLSAPVHAGTQGGDPAGKLVLFVKLLDVDPSGGAALPRDLLSAVRVADVGKPVSIELPGVAHRFAKGHQLRLVVSTSNSTNRGNAVSGPVTIALDDKGTNALTVPKLGAQSGAAGSGDSGTTPFTAAPGAPAPQVASRPAFASGRSAARLPSSTSCKSRRKFTIHLRKAPRGDRIKRAVVTINGKRQKVLRGKRVRAIVNLRGLPKGTFRVLITVRTKKGRTLRSARTYRTCVPGGKR